MADPGDVSQRSSINLLQLPNYITAMKAIPYVALIAYAGYFFAMDIAFANNRGNGVEIPEHTYRSLHALQYPELPDGSTLNDLSMVAFLTPALPARLASTWEIQNMLGLFKHPTVKSGSMIYPTIDKTQYMTGLLFIRHTSNNNIAVTTSAQSTAAFSSCTACAAQRLFDIKNAFVEDQSQFYCPYNYEDERTWLTRTNQQNTTDITEKYKHYMHYKFNAEHATLCRSNRIAPMVLAHVANNIYSMFASQNTVVLLLYIANINTLFGCIIVLYKWYGSSVGNKSFTEITTRHLHGWFSVLFCLLPPLLAIPIVIDYFERKDNNGITSDNRAMGSYILGMWTLLFSFLYVSVLPAFSVVLSQAKTDPQVVEDQSNQPYDMHLHKKHENTLESLAAQQPVITFAYWNLLQAPCFVMLALATQAYGIDIYMQFVVFATIASCVLDVLHARIVIILRVMDNLQGPDFDQMHYFWVFAMFCVMHVIVVLGIYVKITQENMSDAGVALVALVLSTQVCQNLVFLFFQTYNKWKYFAADEQKKPYESMLFNVGLIWHILITGSAFLCAMIANGTAS